MFKKSIHHKSNMIIRKYFYKLLLAYTTLFFLIIAISSYYSYRFLQNNLLNDVYTSNDYKMASISSYLERSLIKEPLSYILEVSYNPITYAELPYYFESGQNPSPLDLYSFQKTLKTPLYNIEYIKSFIIYMFQA